MANPLDDTLGTNFFGDNSTDRAKEAQSRATDEANKFTRYAYDQSRQDVMPWQTAGVAALSGLSQNNFMDNWQKDPGYQFQLDEGTRGINSSMAARGMGNSGAALKSLSRFNQGLASQEYGKVYDRNYNRLSQLAGLGSNAMNTAVNATQAYGNGMASNILGLGNANAAAEIAGANRTANLIGQGMGAGATYAGGGAKASDSNLKKNIHSVSQEDLDEMRKHLKAVAWEYKNDKYGKGEWIGIIAQDLEKSKLGRAIVFEDKDGNKMLDMDRVLCLFLATMAEA